jgi:hypothetical protein
MKAKIVMEMAEVPPGVRSAALNGERFSKFGVLGGVVD